VKASIANSIQRSLEYLELGQLDYALASIDGLAEHIESIGVRGNEAEGAEEFAASDLKQIEAALRDASLDILMQKPEHARARLTSALSVLSASPTFTSNARTESAPHAAQ
jgi:hypothetical protein